MNNTNIITIFVYNKNLLMILITKRVEYALIERYKKLL